MDVSQIIPQDNEKKKKKSGGFQSLDLSKNVYRAILKKGYKVPTPIQRKAIPIIMDGKNVVAMARTGSGKTAAFLIPMLERLKSRIPKSGARALIFSPTRELAMQTLKFTKELAINTGLKATLILGGDKIEDQFTALHESPDIIIATPGRFLHLVVEMDLKLSSVEYVVFDEADRLFEMGFHDQLQEVMNRLPSERQTLLFSATLPKILVDFVKLGVEDPVLIRLDVDLQISENLKTSYFLCRTEDKTAVLLYLLKNVIDLEKELTVVFLATKHHIEYMKDVLEKANIPCSYIYSSLDQLARTINIAKFRTKKVGVMLVTDIAARGIDIPLLDNVINFNFPFTPKLFVHRVGRVARAGRSGKAFSFVAPDETPYLLDLHLYLGKSAKFSKQNMQDEDGLCGTVPQSVIDDETDLLHSWHERFFDLKNMLKVTRNAYKPYLKSRPAASRESIRRMKKFPFSSVETHPIFIDDAELEKIKMLSQMKKYRPNTTIFELGPLAKTKSNIVMREKRKIHSRLVKQTSQESEESQERETVKENKNTLVSADEEDLKGFNQNIEELSQQKRNMPAYLKKSVFRDDEHYLTYVSSEHYKEKGLGLESTFENQAADAVLDFTGDENENIKKLKNNKRWDRKKKKFVQDDTVKSKKMKTESGVWIPKTYKSDVYKKWQEKNKIRYQQNDAGNNGDFGKRRRMLNSFKGSQEKSNRPPRRELKTPEEIYKARSRKERLMGGHKNKNNQNPKEEKFMGRQKRKNQLKFNRQFGAKNFKSKQNSRGNKRR